MISFAAFLSLIGILGCLLYMYIKWKNSIFRRLGIPGPDPGLTGVLFEFGKKGIVGFDPELMNKYGRVVGVFQGRKPSLFISDPEMIREIFVKDFHRFPERGTLLPEDCMLKKSLPNIHDIHHWRFTRSILTTAFTSGKLKKMVPLIHRCLDILVRNFESASKKQKSIHVEELFASFTMDSIATTGFGLEVDSQNDPDDPFVKNARQAVNFSFKSLVLILALMAPFTIPIMEWLDVRQLPPTHVKNFFRSICKSAIEQRKKESSDRRDFLQLALNGHKEKSNDGEDSCINQGTLRIAGSLTTISVVSNGQCLTEEEIVANSLFFLTAGYNTTTITMTFLVHSLALHQDYQERLYREIQDNIGSEPPTYEKVVSLPYLDMVVHETLRKYPPAARLARRAARDVTVKGYQIPEGMAVHIPVWHIHRDPEFWPEPDKFDPERFAPENKDSFNQYCFLPFGIGPRSCIGNRLAILKIKLVVVTLLQRFQFVTTPDTEIVPEIARGGFIRPQNPILLQVEPRE